MALTDNIVSYWKFDSSSSADSVASRTLTANNSPFTSSGKIGDGGAGNGSTSYFSRASETLGVANAWSVSVWMNYSSGDGKVIRWRPASGDANEIRILFYTGLVNALIISSSGSGGSNYKDYAGNTSISSSTYCHAVITWDGTNLKIYVNGSEDTPYTKYTDAAITMTDTSRILGFGGWNAAEYYASEFDEIGIWSRALSDAEATELYNSGSGLQYPFSTGWTGKVSGVTNPAKINGIAVANITKINGVE